MHWSRRVALAALVPFVFSLATLARASDQSPREKVIDAPQGIQDKLMNGAFDEIDAIAKDYRSSRVRLVGGSLALTTLYKDLAEIR